MDIASIITAFSSWANSIVGTWGYLGIFAINLVSTATIFLPVPAFVIVFTFGAILNPWLVGISAALGCSLGELTGYGLGAVGKKAIDKRHDYWLKKANKWMEKYKAFVVIIIFAATPLPDDVIGIICGAVKYDVKKFFLASLTGKLIMNLSLAFGGYFGAQWILSLFFG